MGLSLDLFGVILVSLGAILATLWPSLDSLRLLLGCLGSLLVYVVDPDLFRNWFFSKTFV